MRFLIHLHRLNLLLLRHQICQSKKGHAVREKETWRSGLNQDLAV